MDLARRPDIAGAPGEQSPMRPPGILRGGHEGIPDVDLPPIQMVDGPCREWRFWGGANTRGLCAPPPPRAVACPRGLLPRPLIETGDRPLQRARGHPL